MTALFLRTRPTSRPRVTLRAGDEIVETTCKQRVNWDGKKHLYLNAGAARISHHHTGLLAYCHEFDIPLEVFVSDNRAALLQTEFAFDGKPQQLRRVIMDGRGAIAALAAGTDEAGHAFQLEAGRVFQSEAGHPWRQSHGSI